jgi:leucyl/phenylalanyl-tRNA--protein transferase
LKQIPQAKFRIDHSFDQVIRFRASQPRDGQAGTWIVEEMAEAYCLLHRQGYAHSVETWINGRTGGTLLYQSGGMVFGESMSFASQMLQNRIGSAPSHSAETKVFRRLTASKTLGTSRPCGVAEISRTTSRSTENYSKPAPDCMLLACSGVTSMKPRSIDAP